jgi:hypothetical protein
VTRTPAYRSRARGRFRVDGSRPLAAQLAVSRAFRPSRRLGRPDGAGAAESLAERRRVSGSAEEWAQLRRLEPISAPSVLRGGGRRRQSQRVVQVFRFAGLSGASDPWSRVVGLVVSDPGISGRGIDVCPTWDRTGQDSRNSAKYSSAVISRPTMPSSCACRQKMSIVSRFFSNP